MSRDKFIALSGLGRAGGGKKKPPPTLISPGVISGAPTEGQPLTLTPATWSSATAYSVTRQWAVGPSPVGPWTVLAGANGLTFTVLDGMNDQYLSCLEIARHLSGNRASQSVRSNAVGPVADNIAPTLALGTYPAITGVADIHGAWTFDPGMWVGAVSYEIAVVERLDTDENVIIARRDIIGTDTGSATPTVGYSLFLQVWATNLGGLTSFAESPFPFGPLIAGDILVGAYAFNRAAVVLPNGYVPLGPNANSHVYDAELGFGMGGSLLGGAQFSTTGSKADTRLQGRLGDNLSEGQQYFRQDITEGPGTYKVYAGFTAANAVMPKLGIREGTPTGTLLYELNAAGAISTGGSSGVMDAAGNVTNEADWVAASLYGGVPIEIEVTTGPLFFARASTPGTTHLCTVTIVKES